MGKKILFIPILLSFVCFGQAKINVDVDTFLTKFENKSQNIDYKIFIGKDDTSLYLLKKNSSLDLKNITENKIHITSSIITVLSSLNTEFPHIYLQFGGLASGECPDGYSTPYYVELWQGHYDLPDVERKSIRYCQKEKTGTIGLRIDEKGNPTIFGD